MKSFFWENTYSCDRVLDRLVKISSVTLQKSVFAKDAL